MAGNEHGRLEQKVALTVGCGGYLADAIALRLAEENAAIVLLGYPSERLEKTVKDIRKTCAVEIVEAAVDLTDYREMKSSVEDALQRFGRIDILVNAAWGHNFGLVGEFGEENWDHDLSLNLKTTFSSIEAVSPSMKSRGYGRIVNLSSTAKDGVPWFSHRGHAAHAAARGGVQGFTRALAFELGRHNITVNCVVAGPILNPKSEKVFNSLRNDPEAVVFPTDTMALPRFGEPRDVANAVLFLASDEAKQITGASLYVSGGLYG